MCHTAFLAGIESVMTQALSFSLPSNLSDNDEQEELLLLEKDSESSVSSSAFATPGTYSGTASPPATPPGNGDSSSLLVSVLEKRLLGLVGNHPPSINGLTTESNRDCLLSGDQERECLQELKSSLVRAGSDSGMEEPQFNEDDPHEDGSCCTDASVILSDDLGACNGTCIEGEGTYFADGEHLLLKSSPSHKEDDSDQSADTGSAKKSPPSSSALSDLLQPPFQFVSGTSSPGDSVCSTSISSPTPSSPSPPPPPSPSHSDTKLDDRQPICLLANGASSSPVLVTNEDTSAQLKKKASEPLAPLPILVHCDSAPDFPCLPSPVSPGKRELDSLSQFRCLLFSTR